MARKTITAEDRVRRAFAQLGGTEGSFVNLSDVRYILFAHGLHRGTQDEVLAGMYQRQEINLTPQHNQAALTADQQNLALHLGGEDKHLLSVR